MKMNLALNQATDKVIPIIARADDGTRLVLTGLTGTAITWRLAKESTRDADLTSALSYSLSDNIALTDAANGEFSITIEGADLDSLVGYFTHQCIVILSGVHYRPLFGNATVDKDIA